MPSFHIWYSSQIIVPPISIGLLSSSLLIHQIIYHQLCSQTHHPLTVAYPNDMLHTYLAFNRSLLSASAPQKQFWLPFNQQVFPTTHYQLLTRHQVAMFTFSCAACGAGGLPCGGPLSYTQPICGSCTFHKKWVL